MNNSWFWFTWWDGHVSVQNNGKTSLKFCIIIESKSQDFFPYCSVHQHGRRDVTWKLRLNLFRLSTLLSQYRSRDSTQESIFFQSWTFSCWHAVFLMNTRKVQTSFVSSHMICIGKTTSTSEKSLLPSAVSATKFIFWISALIDGVPWRIGIAPHSFRSFLNLIWCAK